MVKFWFTEKERKDKWREAKRGWSSTRGMTPLQYAAWRDTKMREEKKRKQEELKKRDVEAKKRWAIKEEIEAKRAKSVAGIKEPKKRPSRLKYIIMLAAAAVLVYLVLKYLLG